MFWNFLPLFVDRFWFVQSIDSHITEFEYIIGTLREQFLKIHVNIHNKIQQMHRVI